MAASNLHIAPQNKLAKRKFVSFSISQIYTTFITLFCFYDDLYKKTSGKKKWKISIVSFLEINPITINTTFQQ